MSEGNKGGREGGRELGRASCGKEGSIARGIDGLVNTSSNGQVKGYKGWMAK